MGVRACLERTRIARWGLSLALMAASVAAFAGPVDGAASLRSFGTAPGYALEIHASGLELPTAIAVVEEPGDAADSPIYFVAELKGAIRSVSADGTVRPFATVPTAGNQRSDLAGASQQGLAGLCLAPEQGYVFATYTAPDEGGILRNHIARIQADPRTFEGSVLEMIEIAPALQGVQSAPAHQIGNCVVRGDRLYVGVGDGGAPSRAADVGVLLGKVLCMDLEGSPCDDPPYGSEGPRAYVHASGLRNPFALAHDGERLVAAENGVDLDRFLEIRQGVDHMWDGTDDALASFAELVLPRPFSPVQLQWVPEGVEGTAPGWTGHYVMAGFGSSSVPTGVAWFGGSPSSGKAASPPRYLLQYLGPVGSQHIAGVAVGHGGILVSAMLPVGDSGGAVLRLRYDPESQHPARAKSSVGLTIMANLRVLPELGCTGCHEVAGVGGGIGPVIDRFGLYYRITEALNSEQYEQRLRQQMSDPEDPFAHMNRAREQVLAARDRQRTAVWLFHMLQEPRFDDPDRQMPNLGLTPEQAAAARDELFSVLRVNVGDSGASTLERALRVLRNGWRVVAVGAAAGAAVALIVTALVLRARSSRRRSRGAASRHG